MADRKPVTFTEKRSMVAEGHCPFCCLRLERVQIGGAQWGGCACCWTMFRAFPASAGGDLVVHQVWLPHGKPDRYCAHASNAELTSWL